MQITLINPPVYHNEEGIYPPLGLVSIATYLKQHQYHVKIFDLALEVYAHKRIVDFHFYQNIADELCSSDTDIIGISCQNYTLASALNIAKHTKKSCSDTKIFLGGVGTHGIAENLLSLFPFVDYIVDGEGEEATVDLIHSIETGHFEKIRGVYFRSDDAIIFNGKHAPIMNLDSLPLPDFGLLNHIEDYLQLFPHERRALNIEFARGCGGGCSFCGCFSFWSGKHRYFSIDRVIRNIKELKYRYHINHFYLSDDDFMQNPKRVSDFCTKLIESGINMTWDTRARVDELDEQLLKLMKQAGCSEILIGIESTDDIVLDSMKKKIKSQDQYNAVVKTLKSGIFPILSLILGYPTETRHSINATLQFLVKINLLRKPFVAYFHLLSIVPGTDLYNSEKRNLRKENGFNYPISDLRYEDTPIHPEDIEIITQYPTLCSTFYHLPVKNSVDLLRGISLLAPNAIAAFPFTFELLNHYGYCYVDLIEKYILDANAKTYNVGQFMRHIGQTLPPNTALSEMFRFEYQIYTAQYDFSYEPTVLSFVYDIIFIQNLLRSGRKLSFRMKQIPVTYLFVKTGSQVKVYRQKENS
ncbi:MAG: B12-binding domain-containing radical SAM protein [Clostridium sp.]|nr:B12-binding domain-containing radical SAM protein [Clostridium sp.]